MQRLTLGALLAGLTASSFVAASCASQPPGTATSPGGGTGTTGQAPESQAAAALSAEGPPPATASSVIGPQGGRVASPDGTSVDIPAGALASDQKITITPSPTSRGPAQGALIGPVVVFGPEGLTFSKPVTVTLSFDPELLPPGKTASDIVVYSAPTLSTDYYPEPTRALDATHVTVTTTHFTKKAKKVPPDPCGTGGTADGATSSAPDAGCSAHPPPACKTHGGVRDIKAVCTGARVDVACLCPEHQVNKAGQPCPETCMLDDPQCPFLKNEIDPTIRVMYNIAALPPPTAIPWQMGFMTMGLPTVPGVPPRDMERLSWIHWLAAKFLFNNDKINHYDVKLGEVTGACPADNWAAFVAGTNQPGNQGETTSLCHLPDGSECPPPPPQPPTMYVDPLSFDLLSPADLFVVLGHETIHYMQNERALPSQNLRTTTYNVIQNIRELEAYAWELGQPGPTYEKYFEGESKNKAKACMSNYMLKADSNAQICYEAETELAIYFMLRDSPEGTMLKKFFASDPYGQIWAQNHPNWLTWGKGSKPHVPHACCGFANADPYVPGN